jgi:hypothetical protein
MNRLITVIVGVIGAASLVTVFAVVLWVLIGSGLMPWWIAVGPALVFGLVGLGLLNKWLINRKGG